MAIYKNTPPIVTNGLVVHLDAGNRMSYTSGSTTWRDLSGNSNNATLYNSPVYSNSNGGTLYFNNASSQSALISNNSTLNNWTAQTISVWCTFSALNSYYLRLIEKGANDEWTVAINYSVFDYKLFLQQLGNTTLAITSSNAINDNGYHYTTMTIASNYYCSMYIDGILNGQFQSSAPSSKTGSINISAYGGGGYYWNGNIPIVQIYNRALSAQEVAQNYNALKARFGLT